MEKRGFWHSYGRSECIQNTFGSETEYSFFHENMELRIASFAAREPRRRRCRLRQTPCSYLLRQRSGNTAQQLDQTAYHLTRSDGGLLPPGADHFDRGAKKPWRRKHRLPRRCVTPPGSPSPLIPRDSPFRHNSRGDEGCRVPRVQIPVASAAPPNRTPDLATIMQRVVSHRTGTDESPAR